MPFTHYRTEAFVFKKNDRLEADRIFGVFTHNFGKLEVLAKAVRKITSKLRGGMDIFYLSEIEFVQGKTQKTLTDAVFLERFENIRKDLKKLKAAFKISALLDNFLKFEEKDEEIWRLIQETFRRLNESQLPAVGSWKLYYYFLWNFFSLLGYGPEIYNCSVCQKKLSPHSLYFSPKDGGVVCKVCVQGKKKKEAATEINDDLVKVLRIILKKDWPTFSKLKIEGDLKKIFKNISQDYYRFLLAEHS